MSLHTLSWWNGTSLQPHHTIIPQSVEAGRDTSRNSSTSDGSLLVADSWLVSAGHTLALSLHQDRFISAVRQAEGAFANTKLQLDDFWRSAIEGVPRDGDWFPRSELQLNNGLPGLFLRLRPAPQRTRSVTVATHRGLDPRTTPLTKGPDLLSLALIRRLAAEEGAEEAIIVSPAGWVVEGAYSSLLWWRGNVLCAPSLELERIDSVTARTVLALATALGTEIYYESVTPAELDGCEIWAVSALHGIRIVTAWIDGPSPAEEPGRLELWRRRLSKLVQPLPNRDR